MFHISFASAYTAHLRYEPCCFGWFALLVVLVVLVVWLLGAPLLCLARISLVSPFNSIKVTCASRRTQRLHPCKKNRNCITHWPHAPWCQACVARRAKEDHCKNVNEKEDIGKNIIQLDFFHTHTGEEGRLDETPAGKVQERQRLLLA